MRLVAALFALLLATAASAERRVALAIGNGGDGVQLAPGSVAPLEVAEVAVVPPATAAPCGGVVVAPLGSRAPGVLSRDESCALKPGMEFRECADCPAMVVVPSGSFTMGSPAGEAGRDADESPLHDVAFAKSFAVGRSHVTRGEFAAFVAATGYDPGTKCWTFEDGEFGERDGRSWRYPGFAQSDAHPAACLNFEDASAYVAWLGKRTGVAYRLPSESEFEYAARGQTRPGAYPAYFFGADAKDFCRFGNGADATAKRKVPGASGWIVLPCDDGHAHTSPAGSFPANPFGLSDMHGNVWQWLEDCWHDSYEASGERAPVDGSAWTATGDCDLRVLRGGAWDGYPGVLRAANRDRDPRDYRNDRAGLRVARTLNP